MGYLEQKRNALMNTIASGGGTQDLIDYLNRELTEIDTDQVSTLYVYAFLNQTDLVKINLPSVTAVAGQIGIGSYFVGCSSLRHLNIPLLTTTAGSGFMSGCSSIKVIYIPSLTSNVGNAYNDCISAEKIIIPKAPIDFGAMFTNDTSLKLIDCNTSRVTAPIPSSNFETLINRRTSVASLSNVSNIPNDTCQFYVPSSLVASYKTANNWSSLTNIENRVHAIEGSPYESLTWYESTQEYRTEVLGE